MCERWWRRASPWGAVLLLVSCSPPPPPPGAEVLSAGELGGALPGLSAEEAARFEAERGVFGTSCSSCHGVPMGGDVQAVEDGSAPPGHSPCELFIPPPLWGRGMMEAVAEGTLLALEDPDDLDGDGVSGRVGRDASGRIGRFRRKADVATLAGVAGAGEGEADVNALAEFVRFLAIPKRNMPPGEAEQAQVADGERLFHEVGCATCHIPTLPTGPSPVEALDSKIAPVYSDLLLHDLGGEQAEEVGRCSPSASPTEFRTEILLGTALRARYMHDGSAATVWDAIALHGREGAPSRDAFDRLSERERRALVAFVLSL